MALAFAQDAAAERRLALVIGNGSYAALEPLKNPVADASDVAAALEGLGFEVMRGIDLDRRPMMEQVTRFVRAARDADVSLFYYAGHGFQVDARNYLVPTDAILANGGDIAQSTIELSAITRGIEGSGGIHLFFLDACRNNPLEAPIGGGAGAVRNGLARIGDAAGFLFAFATQPDNVAYDGVGRNSYFAQALLGHINTPGQDIASMLIAVRKDVLAATGGKQVPWENSSLTRQFQFVPGAATGSPETMLWQVAATAQDPAVMRIYLDRYPEGAHVSDGRAFLDKASIAPPPSDGDATARDIPPPAAAVDLADSMWEIARWQRLRPLAQVYLNKNPSGRHADEARQMLLDLPRPDDPNASPELLCERLATHPGDATANTAGVFLEVLKRNPEVAIGACRTAAVARPELPHLTALLARATYAAGHRSEAIRLYRDASNRGDLRAMASLGRILQTGDGVPKDVDLASALSLYERAAAGGSPDAAINLAVALIRGAGIERNPRRAVTLLTRASEAGSALATYNLGVLARNGVAGTEAMALGYFRKAADLGDARGYVSAAILLDEGRGVQKDPDAAAELLLSGAASDSGDAIVEMTDNSTQWSVETIRSVQARLKRIGYYDGELDGLSGPKFAAALVQWRNGGLLDTFSGG